MLNVFPELPHPDHPDTGTLLRIGNALLRNFSSHANFVASFTELIRNSIDEVIDTPRTNRFTLAEVEKTEKTYLGTKIEILLRSLLEFPKGSILDLNIDGIETDIKNTIGSRWTIPPEAFGHPCLLVSSSEETATCSLGVIVARREYMSPSLNRDNKMSFSRSGLGNAWWLIKNAPYPPNFWLTVSPETRNSIMNSGKSSVRIAMLFRLIQQRPISRKLVHAVAQQHDYMKRLRKNGGARDILLKEGIAVLWGQKDRELIEKLGLSICTKSEFISFKPEVEWQERILRDARHVN